MDNPFVYATVTILINLTVCLFAVWGIKFVQYATKRLTSNERYILLILAVLFVSAIQIRAESQEETTYEEPAHNRVGVFIVSVGLPWTGNAG